MKKRWKTALLAVTIISLIGSVGCQSGGDPYVTMEQAKGILEQKKYSIEEMQSIDLLDGTQATGNFLIATKGDNFTLIFTLDDMDQDEAVHNAIDAEYEYNYYITHYDTYYVMTKQAAKDLGVERYINLIK